MLFRSSALEERNLSAAVRTWRLGLTAISGDWRRMRFDLFCFAMSTSVVESGERKPRVLVGMSGGVDSSVAAALIHKAIGDQLTCVFVDHGLLRYKESEEVMATFKDHLGMKVIRVDAKSEFFKHLHGVTDPEHKRKIIGREFVEVFQRESQKLPQAKWLAQGTIYPDVIESAGAKSKKAHNIKSHHNVGGLPDTLQLKQIGRAHV